MDESATQSLLIKSLLTNKGCIPQERHQTTAKRTPKKRCSIEGLLEAITVKFLRLSLNTSLYFKYEHALKKRYICKLAPLTPKVKIGPLEWDIPESIRELFGCKVNERKLVCYKDEFGNFVCSVISQEEGVNETSRRLLMM